MKWSNLDIETRWMFFLGIVLFFLITKEAIVLPLTHDEGNTLYCSTTSVWDIVTYKDPVPNNHILNTLLIKLNQSLFGSYLFSARLHNVLSFIPFFIFTVALGRKLISSGVIRPVFIFSIVLQPFILDFFAVTRGYGLSLSFMMISLYYLASRLDSGKAKHMLYALLWACLGVYANFTLLNYFVPLCILMLIDTYKRYWSSSKESFYRDLLYIFGSGFALIAVIAMPVYKMVTTKQFVYWGTKGFLEDTAKHLIISLRSGVDYFEVTSDFIYTSIISFVLLILVLGNTLNWKISKNKYLSGSSVLLLAVLLYNHLQFYILDVPFLNARTALFFVPLVCVPFSLSLQVIYQRAKNWTYLIAVILLSLQTQHFVRGYNVHSNFEWSYDQNTYQALDYIKQMVESGQAPKPVKINCYWIFYPSMSYHVSQNYAEYIQIMPWDTKIKNDGESVFYYTESGEKDALLERFDIVQDYGYSTRLLMRAKGK